jgi:hypothetical protein
MLWQPDRYLARPLVPKPAKIIGFIKTPLSPCFKYFLFRLFHAMFLRNIFLRYFISYEAVRHFVCVVVADTFFSGSEKFGQATATCFAIAKPATLCKAPSFCAAVSHPIKNKYARCIQFFIFSYNNLLTNG